MYTNKYVYLGRTKIRFVYVERIDGQFILWRCDTVVVMQIARRISTDGAIICIKLCDLRLSNGEGMGL